MKKSKSKMTKKPRVAKPKVKSMKKTQKVTKAAQKSKSASVRLPSKSTSMKSSEAKKVATQGSMSTPQLVAMFVSCWLVGIVIVGVASLLFPGAVALGTYNISPLMALVMSMGVLSLLGVACAPVIETISRKEHLQLGMTHWIVLYFVINVLLIWGLARLSEVLGFGISGWMVAVVLGLLLDFAQGMAIGVVMEKVK